MDATNNPNGTMNYVATDNEFATLSWSSKLSSTIESEKQPVEGVAYHHRLIIATCFCIITVLGMIGNTLVIVAVIVSKKLQTTTNILVVNLAIADLFMCLILPFMVVGLVDHSDEYPLPEIICSIVTGINFVSLAVSVTTLAAISFVRWYVISKSIRGHRGLHTPRKIGMMVVGIWMMVIILGSLPLSLGIGEIGYSRYYSLCSVTDTNPRRIYFVFLQAGVIFIALVITGIFYVLIVVHVTRQTRQLRKRFADDSGLFRSKANAYSNVTNAAFMKREIEITKNLFIVVIIFTICLLPSVVNFIIPGHSVFTIYGSMFLASNSSINPIIYALKHPDFQEAFKKVFSCRLVENHDYSSNENRISSTHL